MDDRILDAEEVANLYRELCDAAAADDASLAGEVLDALTVHDRALRARLHTAETERDAQQLHGDAMTAAANREIAVRERAEARARAAEARVEALTQALRDPGTHGQRRFTRAEVYAIVEYVTGRDAVTALVDAAVAQYRSNPAVGRLGHSGHLKVDRRE